MHLVVTNSFFLFSISEKKFSIKGTCAAHADNIGALVKLKKISIFDFWIHLQQSSNYIPQKLR